jgi:hypothetical protein
MKWRQSGSPRPAPKNSECKNLLEKFSPRYFWGSRGPKYQRRVLRISAGAIEGHFEVKSPCAGSNWSAWASNVLIIYPILRIWPGRTTTCSLDRKKQLKCVHFSSETEFNAAAETWLDGQYSDFFEWIANVRATN